jgi:hypothetical protein
MTIDRKGNVLYNCNISFVQEISLRKVNEHNMKNGKGDWK